MDVLFLGLDAHGLNLLRKQVESTSPKARVHCCTLEEAPVLADEPWDVMVLGSKVQLAPELARQVKRNRHPLKIVLTEKEHLKATTEFWGTDVYSYFLKPINRDLLQLVWQNAAERVELSKKLSRLSRERREHRAGVQEQQEVMKSLFITHLKMQELNQEKTNFLAQTSHELLTPLTAVHGYLQLLADGKAGPVNELQSRVLRSSLESCTRLLRLSQSLTDLVTLDRSNTFLQLEHGDFQRCLSRAISEINEQLKSKNQTLNLDVAPEIPPFRFDFDRMQQVFVNLLANANKFTSEGGSITVRCEPQFWERRTFLEMINTAQERRRTSAPSGINSVRVVVEDTGVGIPAEFLQDIFEEYSRGSNEAGAPRGFGLGLAVARRIVVAHQGKIWAESKPQQGSSFTVLIPISL